MAASLLTLEVLSPTGCLFKGEVSLVRCPGSQAPFTVLPLHAPLISSLQKGRLSWKQDQAEGGLEIKGGFVEVLNNKVWVCIVQ